jgi:hypothetical protein
VSQPEIQNDKMSMIIDDNIDGAGLKKKNTITSKARRVQTPNRQQQTTNARQQSMAVVEQTQRQQLTKNMSLAEINSSKKKQSGAKQLIAPNVMGMSSSNN